MKRISAIVLMLLCSMFVTACGNHEDDELVFRPNVNTVGVWWWHNDDTIINGPYLDFAAKNGITEIYYSSSSISQRHSDFIARASAKNIKVYWLQGEYSWIHDDSGFRKQYSKYLTYQADAPENRRFAGIHLDVEPHQDPTWDDTTRADLLAKYLNFITNLRGDFPTEHFDLDIPFWFNDNVTYRGQQNVPLNQALIQETNRIFIMSYRDTAEKMFNLGTVPEQIELAKSLNKPIFLCAESNYASEGNTIISYKEKGKRAMYSELNKLKNIVNYDKLGISIHHIKSWYELKQ